MSNGTHRALFEKLLVAKSGEDVRQILESIGDSAAAQLDEPLGVSNYRWRAFGDNLSNISTIGLATKPGRSLTERLTNAMDALLEGRVSPGMQLPTSSREAAQAWFGRPMSAPDEGLFNWAFDASEFDRRIAVVMLESGVETAPTIDVLDLGVGLRPQEFPSTILSLQSGNKINRRYLIGAFGQGGSSTMGFADYVAVFSRSKEDPETLAFTVIRVVKLDESYKEDAYGYLCVVSDEGGVPFCNVGTGPLDLYPDYGLKKKYELSCGTLVRHFNYRLSNIYHKLSASPGNLYHYLHCSVFDPLFPFRIVDIRDENVRDERVSGSRNRLMRLVKKAEEGGESDGRIEVRHYRPMEYVVPVGTDEPCIGIEYWVVLAERKTKRKGKEETILRSQSNELFIEANHPIVATMNGQNQGERTAKLIRDLGLGMLSKHMVIHIDATNASSRTRRELFATSREGLKEGPVLDGLMAVIRRMLEEDNALADIEQELTDRLSAKATRSTNEEVKRQVSKLLREAGYRVRDDGTSTEPGEDGEDEGVRRKKRRRPVVFDPLPTLPYPDVTRFEIVHPTPSMQIAINDTEIVLLETDADSRFDREGRIAFRIEPDSLELAAVSPLRGGRLRWRLRPRAGAAEGSTGRIIATITKLDGTQMIASTSYEVLAERQQRTRDAKGDVPPFEIVPINPTDNPEEWGLLWPHLAEEEDEDKLQSVAYRPMKQQDGINVYYSTIFNPLAGQLHELGQRRVSLMELFKTNYEIWIAYHAILQVEGGSDSDEGDEASEELVEKMLDEDRVRVATMQVKQALRTAELMHEALKLQAAAEV